MINIFFYIRDLNEIQKLNLQKLKNISIIYRNYERKSYEKNAFEIHKICKMKGFKFFIANNYKFAIQIGANGIYIPSFNKKMYTISNPKIDIIGSAHSSIEINQKIKQGCKKIFLSPIFQTKDYKKSKILGVHKFNNLRRLYENKAEIFALGGINEKKFKYIISHKIKGIGSIGILEKKINCRFLNVLNLIARKP